MDIKKYVLGPLGTNTYVLIEGDDVLVVDPASKGEKILDILKGYNVKAVLLTHGHFDHIKSADDIWKKYNCPVYLNENDEEMARDKSQGASFGMVSYITCPTVNAADGIVSIGSFSFEIIETPGHTEGSVIYRFGDDIITGDTLFRLSVGRTDLKGGSERKLKESLKMFKGFDNDNRIHPGHGDSSTIGYEKANNPFMKNI